MSGSALIAFMMSFSLTCTLLGAVTRDYPWPMAALCCAAVVLVCAVVALNRVTAIVGAAVAAVGVIFTVAGGAALITARLHPFEALTRAVEAVGARAGGQAADLHAEVTVLLVFLSVLFGVVSLLMVRLSGGVYPAALLFVFVLLGSWFLNQSVQHMPLIPGLIALAVLYARAFRENGSILRALPAALIAALLAVSLTPASPVTWQPLQDAADKVREMFNDYFLFNDPRIVYSVSTDGYQPRVDALGGPATPRREDVMTVKTDDSMLLRGSVSRSYTGRAWVDEAVNSRYLFGDPTRLGRRNAAFDVDLVDRLKGLLRPVKAEVTFVGEGTSTLFVPHRLTALTTRLDMPVYYNETGETFITRGVQPGDSYAFEAWLPDADWTALSAAIDAASETRDGDWAAVQQEYMTLPGTIEADLYWLLMDLIEDAQTPVQKALAIRDYLSGSGFAYSLEGRYPTDGRDFVSWFVLEERKGYCTYYASAMAVMARLAGIPSRYVEGYRVMADGTGEVLVTGADAHAWAELYFNGVGWMAFDVTPGQGGERPDRPDNSGAGEPSAPPGAPSATPEPTAEPAATPEPSEAPDAGAPPSAEPGASDEPDGEPTPGPEDGSDEPDVSDAPDASQENDSGDGTPPSFPLWLLLLLLLALAAAALAGRRFRRSGPKYLAAHEKDGRVRVMIWYRAILCLLARSGLTPEGGETPEMFAGRVSASEGVPDELASLARMVAQMQYSPRDPDERAAALGETVYGALVRRMGFRQRVKWHADRMLHGIGDYRQVP